MEAGSKFDKEGRDQDGKPEGRDGRRCEGASMDLRTSEVWLSVALVLPLTHKNTLILRLLNCGFTHKIY